MADEKQEPDEEKQKKRSRLGGKKALIGIAVAIVVIVLIILYAISSDNLPFMDDKTGPNHAPIADAGDNINTTEGEEVTFDASGSSDPDGDHLTFLWDFDDGVKKNGMIVKRYFNASGTFDVELTVSDGVATDTDKIVVTVIATGPSEPPVITLGQEGKPGTIIPPKQYIVTVLTAQPAEETKNFTFGIYDDSTGKFLLKMDVEDLTVGQTNVSFVSPTNNQMDFGDTFTITPDSISLPAEDGDEFILYYKFKGEDVEVARVTFDTPNIP